MKQDKTTRNVIMTDMKTINDKISNDKAKAELRLFAWLGLVLSVLGLFVIALLGMIGVACSLRALILSSHSGNTNNPKKNQFKIIAFVGLIVGVFDTIVLFSN